MKFYSSSCRDCRWSCFILSFGVRMIRWGSIVIEWTFSSLVATCLAFLCSSRWTPSGIVRFKFRFECSLTLFWIPTTSSSILMCWNRAWEFFACCGFLRRLCRCRSFSRLWWFRSMQSSPMSANPSISANWFAAWFSRTYHSEVDAEQLCLASTCCTA